MLFTQPLFLVFFVGVFAVAWIEKNNTRRKLWLLVASYLFYAGWDWRFLSLIGISTLVDFVAAKAIRNSQSRRAKRAWLIASLATNLGILGFFKYFGFFVESALPLLRFAGFDFIGDRALEIILPVGISFFTFQSMSYTIDVYREKLAPVGSLLDFSLFVAFFPQLVAGPIVRARSFLPQLVERPQLRGVDFRGCSTLFLLGFIKKSCIADNVAPIVEKVFADPVSYSVQAVWIGVLLYAVQIYCDFSGYSDMAIATARLLGYELGPNFDFPYFASTIADFWKRWHISLSSWLRDYLYIPLGGNRGSTSFVARNLMLTMLLGGLWHGAAWTFVAWGALHGIGLVVVRNRRKERAPFVARVPQALGGVLTTAATFYFVCLAWIFFRAETFEAAVQLTRAFVLLRSPGTGTLEPLLFLLFGMLGAVHYAYFRGWIQTTVDRLPGWCFSMLFGVVAALAAAFVPMRASPFIYFQF